MDGTDVKEFQSLLGFPMRCDRDNFDDTEEAINGFNPYWVFQCAATDQHYGAAANPLLFQSLLGFPMRCDSCPQVGI